MRRPVALAALAAALWLCGCYASERLLLDPARAAHPLAAGRQQAAGASTETVEVRLEPDGWYRIRSGDRTDRVLFVPMTGGPEGRYAFAFRERSSFVYGVAEKRGGQLVLDLPFCDLGPARDAAIAHGVAPPGRGALAPVCSFSRPADLLGALEAYADRPGPHDESVILPAAP
jgi:hypothetical protein